MECFHFTKYLVFPSVFAWARSLSWGIQTHTVYQIPWLKKGKSKPPGDTTSHLSEWLLSERQEITNVGEDVQNPLCTIGGNIIGAATMESSMGVPLKIKNITTVWFSNSTSGYLSEEDKNTNSKDIGTHVFTAALFTTAKIWKQSKCPSTDEWMQKMWSLYTVEYYSAIKKNESLPFVTTWTDLKGIMLNEISLTEKDRYCMI